MLPGMRSMVASSRSRKLEEMLERIDMKIEMRIDTDRRIGIDRKTCIDSMMGTTEVGRTTDADTKTEVGKEAEVGRDLQDPHTDRRFTQITVPLFKLPPTKMPQLLLVPQVPLTTTPTRLWMLRATKVSRWGKITGGTGGTRRNRRR